MTGARGRVFVTGDVHGVPEVGERFGERCFPEGAGLGRDDTVIVAGDFGLPWGDPESETDARWLDWLESRPWTTAWVNGNHENFSALEAYPVGEWNGGRAQRIREHVVHLMRGEAFDIAGLRVFAFGGAASPDRALREPGVSWWPQEVPSPEEMEHGRQMLERCRWKVDVVVTHCAPSALLHAMDASYGNDATTRYLNELWRALDYGRWFYGHYHVERDLDWARATALYRRIIEVEL